MRVTTDAGARQLWQLLSKGAEVDAALRIARHSESEAIKVLWRVLRAAYPLHHACSNGRLQDVEGFLREGDVDVNARDHKGRVPLHEASRKGHLHVVRALLAAHAQVDVKDKKNKSPLHLAAFESHREVFLALESAGADAFSNMRLLLNKDSSFSSSDADSSSSSSSDEDETEVDAVMQAEEAVKY
jgi:ankyrin repeat protein